MFQNWTVSVFPSASNQTNPSVSSSGSCHHTGLFPSMSVRFAPAPATISCVPSHVSCCHCRLWSWPQMYRSASPHTFDSRKPLISSPLTYGRNGIPSYIPAFPCGPLLRYGWWP